MLAASPPPAMNEAPAASARTRLAIDGQGVATLTFGEAGSLNIIGSAVIDDLRRMLERIAADPQVAVLVLRGSGERAFCGGADIREMSALTPAGARAFIERLRALCDAVRAVPVPVVARLAGWCLGGGLEVALAADLRIAAADSRFGMPEVVVGIPSVIHAALLPRLIGESAASWLLLTGETVDAERALAWGLVHEVHPPPAFDAAVAERASRLAVLPRAALRAQKRLLREWEAMPLDAAIAASVDAFAEAFSTGEPQAAMAAFFRRQTASPP